MSPKTQKKSNTREEKNNCLYTLEIFLLEGLITQKYADQNPEVIRTIQIKNDQTLQDLHKIIFTAFDRFEEHMYEFQFGDGPQQSGNKCYVLPTAAKDSFSKSKKPAGLVTETTIGSLGLQVDQAFGYWFDFGDNWYHQINVLSIDTEIPAGKYPKVIDRIGDSPPQYPDFDEDEDIDDDEDDDEDEDDDDED